ncbi:proline-rich protein 5-like [Grus japonensis]|uniref:Proline-rich protein 5-like n=1 Tax=Grus japonensis TaxID=30415 RepID=A0ABC9WXY4_GRUJA
MGSFRRPRPRFMSSPVLSDLPRFQAARQARQLSSNSAWNSVQTAVINVFKGGGLQNNELYTLNENIRRLLKSELGSFITDYFQGPAKGKRRDNGCLFWRKGQRRKSVSAGNQSGYCLPFSPTNINAACEKAKDEGRPDQSQM